MKKLMIAGLAIMVIAGLCYGGGKVNVNLVSKVGDHSTTSPAWNIKGQEFTVYLAKGDSAFELLAPPSMDTVRLLHIHCVTLDANDNPYTFRFCWGDTTKALQLSNFLGVDLTHKSKLGIPAASSIWVANDNAHGVAIELRVFIAGQD